MFFPKAGRQNEYEQTPFFLFSRFFLLMFYLFEWVFFVMERKSKTLFLYVAIQRG